MTTYRQQVHEVVKAVSIVSPSRFAWFGLPSPAMPPALLKQASDESIRNFVLFHLNIRFYNHFYVLGRAHPVISEESTWRSSRQTDFVRALSEANSGHGQWEPGWEHLGREGQRVVATRDGLKVWLEEGKYDLDKDQNLQTAMRIQLPKEFPSLSPGYYMALGDHALSAHGRNALVRLYWNLTPDAVPSFMRRLTTLLNGASLAFRFKVINDPGQYKRCDAAVLYIERDGYEDARPFLELLYEDFHASLKPSVPALTKSLAPGLGLAEDPGNSMSFGQHRCSLIADAMLEAFERGIQSQAAIEDCIEARFVDGNVNIDAPYLRANSNDGYQFTPRIPTARSKSILPDPVRDTDSLGSLASIAEQISSLAIWHADRCTWLAKSANQTAFSGEQSGLHPVSLGPDVYQGTAGIALFLGEAAASLKSESLRATSLGAISQSLRNLHQVPPNVRLGMFAGWAGIAWVAARLGFLLDEPALIEQSREILLSLSGERVEGHELDLVSGNAGAILALLSLDNALSDRRIIADALDLADELMDAAELEDEAASWRMPAYRHWHNLTGLSHGASGIGLALLELFHFTGHERLREMAVAALNYERRNFNSVASNWPDFRGFGRGKQFPDAPCSTAWCHGAPGVALSRLRASEVFNDSDYTAEACIGSRTTLRYLLSASASSASASTDYGLCHGLAGLIEVLLATAEVLTPEEQRQVSSLSDSLALDLKRRLANSTPIALSNDLSLMTGESGLGYFLLRKVRPETPSILALSGLLRLAK